MHKGIRPHQGAGKRSAGLVGYAGNEENYRYNLEYVLKKFFG
jgi:hypothetical protein